MYDKTKEMLKARPWVVYGLAIAMLVTQWALGHHVSAWFHLLDPLVAYFYVAVCPPYWGAS